MQYYVDRNTVGVYVDGRRRLGDGTCHVAYCGSVGSTRLAPTRERAPLAPTRTTARAVLERSAEPAAGRRVGGIDRHAAHFAQPAVQHVDVLVQLNRLRLQPRGHPPVRADRLARREARLRRPAPRRRRRPRGRAHVPSRVGGLERGCGRVRQHRVRHHAANAEFVRARRAEWRRSISVPAEHAQDRARRLEQR